MARDDAASSYLGTRVALVGALGAVLAIWAWWPMFDGSGTPLGDGRYFLHLFDTAKVSLLRYHELPLWNPYECGGAPLWDNPESMAASPIVMLATPLSATHTVWLWNVLHLTAGFTSMWMLARMELGVSRGAAFYASAIFMFAVCNASQYAGAHTALMSFMWAPLALLLWRRAERSPSCAVGLGLLVALLFYDGATYPIPHTALMLGLETLTRLRSRDQAKRVVVAGLLVVAVAVLVAGPRLLPLADQFRSKVRVIPPDTDALSWSKIADMYLKANVHTQQKINGDPYVWGEYTSYVGLIAVVLALAGCVIAAAEAPWMLVVALGLLVLMLGHFASWAPWTLLTKNVFPFKSMRVPARFRLLLVGYVAMFGALAVDRIPRRLRQFVGPRPWVDAISVALLACALIGAGEVAAASTKLVSERFTGPPEKPVVASTRLFYGGGDMVEYASQPRQNRGQLACRDAWAFSHGAAVWTGDVPQARATDDGANVMVANRTQNTFDVDVEVTRPTRIVLNSGYERGWRASVGTVADQAKLLAVDLPPGHHKLHVWYWPHGLTAGFVMAALGIALSTAVLARKRIFKERA